MKSPPRGRDDRDRRDDCRPRRDDPPREAERGGNREVINTIAGGWSTNNTWKKHLWAVHQVNAVTFRHLHRWRLQGRGLPPGRSHGHIGRYRSIHYQEDPCWPRSSVHILYWKTFKAMRIPEVEMVPYGDHAVEFLGEKVGTKGYIELYTTFG